MKSLLLFASCDFFIIVSSSLLTLCTQARAFFAAAHVVSVPRKILLSILSTTCFCLSPLSAHCLTLGWARPGAQNGKELPSLPSVALRRPWCDGLRQETTLRLVDEILQDPASLRQGCSFLTGPVCFAKLKGANHCCGLR